MLQPGILVLTDDGDFAKDLLSLWQHERVLPTFTVSGNEALNGALAPQCDLAIVARIQPVRLVPVLKTLDASSRSTLCLCDSAQLPSLRASFPRVTFVPDNDAAALVVFTVALEALRRIDALGRARRAEQVVAQKEHDASLGRFMLETRHSLNNALTSILGNAELLLLDPSKYSAEIREQIETIHTMSLKMHEMFYRFSSLENERHFAEKLSQSETRPWAESAAAGD